MLSKKIYLLLVTCILINSLFSQSTKKIEIINANSLEFDQSMGINAKRLIGDVIFKHENATMYCDSAYFYDANNLIEAFSNVIIEQGDSLRLTGNRLSYDGNLKIAQVRDTVILKHNISSLETDYLDYNRDTDIAYYFNGGKIYHEENLLFSERGYYYSKENNYYAVDSVELHNPKYKIYCDTLKYNTQTSISYFFGPTHIISDSNYIYCETGFYDTEKDLASLYKNTWIKSGQNILKGDSIFYDRNIRHGEAFSNVELLDTVENIFAYGNYGYYYEDPHFGMLTDSITILYVSDQDSIFMSSDTIYFSTDSLDNKLIRAFYKVQVFSKDIQARCDSLVYSEADSLMQLFVKPIVWMEDSQLTADFMTGHFKDDKLSHAIMHDNSLVIEHVDSIYYNQIKGNRFIAFFKDNEIDEVNVFEDSKTIYFIEDEDTEDIIALNRVICSDMKLKINDKKIERIWFYEEPEGKAIPIEKVSSSDLTLPDFIWHYNIKPKSKKDIFIWNPIE